MSSQAVIIFISLFMSLSIILLLISFVFSINTTEYNFANYEFVSKLKSNSSIDISNELYTIDMSKWRVFKPKFNRIVGNGLKSLITLVYFGNSTKELNSLQLFDPIERIEFYNIYFKIVNKNSNHSLLLNNDGIFSYLSHCYLYNIHIYMPNNVIIKSFQSGASILSNEIYHCNMFHIGIYFNILSVYTDNYNQKLGLITQKLILSEDENIFVGIFVKGNILNYNISNYQYYSGFLFGELKSSSIFNTYFCLSHSFVDINIVNIYSKFLLMKKIDSHIGGLIGYITTEIDFMNGKKQQPNNNNNNNKHNKIKLTIKNCYIIIKNGMSIFKYSENDYSSINYGCYIGNLYKSETYSSSSSIFNSKVTNNQKIILEISESLSYISINNIHNSFNNKIFINGVIGSISNADNNIIIIIKDSYSFFNLLSLNYNKSIALDNFKISMEIINKEIVMEVLNSYSFILYSITNKQRKRIIPNEEKIPILYCYYRMNKCDYIFKNNTTDINHFKEISNYQLKENKENNIKYYYYKYMPYYLDNKIINFNTSFHNSDIYYYNKTYNYYSTSYFYSMILTPFYSLYDNNKLYEVVIIPKTEEIRRIYYMNNNNNITVVPSNPCIKIRIKSITVYHLNLTHCLCKMREYSIYLNIRINDSIYYNDTLSFYCLFLNNSIIKNDIEKENFQFNTTIEDNHGIDLSDNQNPFKFIMMILCFLLIIACGCNIASRSRNSVIKQYRVLESESFGNEKEYSDDD